MRLSKRAWFLFGILILVVAAIIIVPIIPPKHGLSVAFVNYEEAGQYVILRLANHSKTAVRTLVDVSWRFATVNGVAFLPGGAVPIESGESAQVALIYVGSPSQKEKMVHLTYTTEPSRNRARVEQLLLGIGIDVSGWRRAAIRVDLRAVPNPANIQRLDGTH